MPSAITVENVSKRYVIQHARERTLRDELTRLVRRPLRLFTRSATEETEEFWALRDMNFTIRPGEIVGILGRNGAGKSTLLKVLSRVTRPTSGRVTLRGRVGSLLEVGVGFNPELTGRDNVYLSGAILGMGRKEIERKFDAIVAFAEIDRFLDTPVKRYSSGMYLRLAFAVAIHLEPDILIIDEVLAVGDATFQQKCLAKIRELVNDERRAVLFVSHDTIAVRALCNRGLVLHQGRLVYSGDIDGALRVYRNAASLQFDADGQIVFSELRWSDAGLSVPERAVTTAPLALRRCYTVGRVPAGGDFAIHYYAGRETTLGSGEEFFLGSELISGPGKELGAHEGAGPLLRVGRPGDWHIIAILDAEDNDSFAGEPTRVIAGERPVVVSGPIDLILDNGRPGYSETGSDWITSNLAGGYGGSYRSGPAGSGSSLAVWEFHGLEPGDYEVQATWFAWSNRATNAPYRIYDQSNLVRTVRVNQQYPPVGTPIDGCNFESLGRVTIATGTVRVTLANDADGWVIADAVRLIERPR